MNFPTMTRPQAALELALWQAEADSMSSSDLYVWLRDCGLPPEVAIRLKDLINVTKQIAGKAISLGKVIVIKLIEFVKAHPNMAVGIALGAMLSSLITSVPFFGPLLAPVLVPLGIAVGAIAGHRFDMAAGGRMSGTIGIVEITQDLIEIARLFFQLFIDTVLALSDEVSKETV
jgi:uncharacterized membrane protein